MTARRYVTSVLLTALLIGCDGPQPSSGVAMTTQATRMPWKNGQVIRTAHYRIYSTVTDRELQEYLPGFMEAAYENYLSLTQLPPVETDAPLDMYVLGTRSEWAALTEHRLQEQAPLFLQLEAGGYCLNGVCVLWDLRSNSSTMAVASHEGLHQFFWRRLKHRIPMWAEEGLCTVAEGIDLYGNVVRFTPDRNVHRYNDLRKAIVQGYWVDLAELLSMGAADAISGRPLQATGYYGQVWSLILYIQTQPAYRSGFHRMLLDAQEGRLHEAVGMDADYMARMRHSGRNYNTLVAELMFRRYITEDLEAFERDWKRFAHELVDIPSR